MKYIPVLLASLLFSSIAYAVPDIKEAPGYEVEILVFKNLQANDQESEIWPHEILSENQPDLENAIPVGGGIPANSSIRKAYEKMLESGNYELVSHKRWIQDAVQKADTQLIRIANTEVGFDGTVGFYKNRFLHLDLNLILAEEFIPSSNNDVRVTNNPRQEARNYFVINEKRRIRTKNMNYFDHPKFGVLVQVNAVKISSR